MSIFPLPIYPQQNYHYAGIAFGGSSKSRGDRRHAACDLIAPPGTPVYAVERGIVLEVPRKPFYQHTFTVVIRHAHFVIRYGEVHENRLVSIGEEVSEGQQIGTVGTSNRGNGMLHFEMYQGTASGSLSQKHNTEYLYVPPLNYQRRKDLIDPTPYLDSWMLWSDLNSSCIPEESPNSSE
ncbi:MAG: M23 family metallopeptidase [Pyrinomonadaceae bacterium]